MTTGRPSCVVRPLWFTAGGDVVALLHAQVTLSVMLEPLLTCLHLNASPAPSSRTHADVDVTGQTGENVQVCLGPEDDLQVSVATAWGRHSWSRGRRSRDRTGATSGSTAAAALSSAPPCHVEAVMSRGVSNAQRRELGERERDMDAEVRR
ncbi:hypothetical protein INR49_011952 [Caranx melampygus]|nr:hypothetical protein INR49_011952 [Caranx melampygus]